MQSRISPDFSEAKLGRWLGWAQAAVVAANIGVTLDDVKALNKRFADPVTPDPNPAEVERHGRFMHGACDCGEEFSTIEEFRAHQVAIQALDAHRATVAKTDTHVADITRVKAEAIDDAIRLLDACDPGWPRHPYSPMSCLEDHKDELTRATALENGVGDE